jgi:myo-inositol-1(or 4)-monophosphatase
MSSSGSPTKRARTASTEKPGASVAATELDAIYAVAIKAARAAGAHMKAHLRTATVEKTKSNKDDLVTVVDKQCQDLIFQTIQEAFPQHDFLGEENVEAGSEASARALKEMQDKDWLWIVDPIDGTTNFVHHRPASVVSVACAHKGEVVVGVILDPYRDELFSAQKGKGTKWNEEVVHVSNEATFSEALIAFGIGTKDSVRLPMLDCVREFSAKCRGIRLQGASALELAWTCCGRQSVRSVR